MKIPVSSRPSIRKNSRERRRELTGELLSIGRKRRMKKKLPGFDHAFDAMDQDCSEELSELLRGISGGRRIHDPGVWIQGIKHGMHGCPDTFTIGEDHFIL